MYNYGYMPTFEIEPAEQAIVDHYLGWQAFAAAHPDTVPSDEFGVLDTNLLASGVGSPTEYASMDQIRGRTEELYATVDGSMRDSEMVKRKLEASILLARIMSGKAVDFGEYFEAATGTPIQLVTAADMADARMGVVRMLDQQGIEYSPDGKQDYMDRFSIGQDRIKPVFEAERLRTLPLLQRHVNYEPEDTKITVEPVDAMWVAWLDFNDAEGFNTRINSNTKLNPQTDGRVAGLVAHEYMGHAFQFSMWRNGLIKGEINPVLGLITTHTPEATQFEGIAHLAMHRFLPSGPWINQYEAAYDRLRLMAMHNGHMEVAAGNSTVKQAVGQMAELLPFEPVAKLEASLEAAAKDKLWKAYGGCYYPGFKILEPLLRASDVKLATALPELYSRPMHPTQMAELVAA